MLGFFNRNTSGQAAPEPDGGFLFNRNTSGAGWPSPSRALKPSAGFSFNRNTSGAGGASPSRASEAGKVIPVMHTPTRSSPYIIPWNLTRYTRARAHAHRDLDTRPPQPAAPSAAASPPRSGRTCGEPPAAELRGRRASTGRRQNANSRPGHDNLSKPGDGIPNPRFGNLL